MLGSLINAIFFFMYIAMLGRVLSSWFSVGPDSSFYPIIVFLHQVTEPILAPIRRVLPRFGRLDLSPMVALLLLGLIQNVLVDALGV